MTKPFKLEQFFKLRRMLSMLEASDILKVEENVTHVRNFKDKLNVTRYSLRERILTIKR